MTSAVTPVWHKLLSDIMRYGEEVSPRGQSTLEIPQASVAVNMRFPVLISPARKPSYRFMAAEAYWILVGDDLVETIAPYNKNIAQFSDDGVRFFGAYGPPIQEQLPYVISKLIKDPMSRQAGLTIWRPSPPETKDVPCTVAIFATIRDHMLRLHVFMRSSDAWLGVPYDVFNFSMLGHLICARYNSCMDSDEDKITPGDLHLTMASSHLYRHNIDGAKRCIDTARPVCNVPTPSTLYLNEELLIHTLRELRESTRGNPYRWWESES